MFDLKSYVDKKRESKLNEMMNSFNPMNSTSGGFVGGIPNIPRPEAKPQLKNDSFDIDSLVKRIDAKIAELEEQEKQENAAKLAKDKVAPIDNKSVQPIENKVVTDKVEDSKPANKIETKPIPEFKQDIKPEPLPEIKLKEEENRVINGVTDDEFFDDFFNDEE